MRRWADHARSGSVAIGGTRPEFISDAAERLPRNAGREGWQLRQLHVKPCSRAAR
jgi:hypothetical protein